MELAKERPSERLLKRLQGRKITQQPVYDKTKAKSKKDSYFFRLPKDIEHYIYIPEVKAEMFYLYVIISDYYNTDEGCAYPSISSIQFRYGKNAETISEHLKVLQAVGLIDVCKRHGITDLYRPLEPLKTDEFYKVFPEARDERNRIFKKIAKDAEEDKSKWEKWKQKMVN